MEGGLDGVVGPACEEVACVDYDGAFDGFGVDEGAFGTQDLKAAAGVLEEKRDRAVV